MKGFNILFFSIIICHLFHHYLSFICRCKTCVKHLYCNEQCRDSAWAEFHHWECLAVRAKVVFINHHAYLALRIIFKALSMGLTTSDLNFEKIQEYGSKNNNYNFVYNYNLPRKYLNEDVPEKWFMIYSAVSANNSV